LLFGLCAEAQALKVEKLGGRFAAGAGERPGRELEVTAGEAFVKFKAGTSVAQRSTGLERFGARALKEFDGGWTLVALPPGMPVGAGLGFLLSLSEVEAAEPNQVHRALRTPNDPSLPAQWHLSAVNAASAWEYEVGASSLVTIAVMDSGIDGSHPELSGKLVVGKSRWFSPNIPADTYTGEGPDSPPTAACDHATMVSGVAAAASDNGAGIAGASWGARLVSLKVFNDADCTCDLNCNALCQANCGTNDATMIAALDHARTTLLPSGVGRLIVNISLGGAGLCTAALQTAVDNAVGAGIVLIAAAGNDGGDVHSPAKCGNVIPVGATDMNNNIAAFSSRGTALATNGVVAPGVSIYTTYPVSAGSYHTTQGTSFSAPLVSGIAALILANKPTFTVTQVKDTLRGSAVSIGGMSAQAVPQGSASGAGLVNAFRAMRLAQGTLSSFEGDQKSIAFPNPFRPSRHGSATFTVPPSLAGRNLKIKIFTPDGQLVRDLGARTTWDGRNAAGREVASGTYLFLVSTDSGSQRGRIAVIR